MAPPPKPLPVAAPSVLLCGQRLRCHQHPHLRSLLCRHNPAWSQRRRAAAEGRGSLTASTDKATPTQRCQPSSPAHRGSHDSQWPHGSTIWPLFYPLWPSNSTGIHICVSVTESAGFRGWGRSSDSSLLREARKADPGTWRSPGPHPSLPINAAGNQPASHP